MSLNPIEILPSLGREIWTGGEQIFLETLRRQMNSRYFSISIDGTTKFNHFQRFFDVQFARLAMRIHAAVVVHAIGEVRIFLHFAYHHSWADRVRSAGRNKKSISRLHAPVNEEIFQRLTFAARQEFFRLRL